MTDELISKQKILNTLREWENEDLPRTMYGDGYEDAVRDIIKLIETEVPIGAETKVMNDDLISRQRVKKMTEQERTQQAEIFAMLNDIVEFISKAVYDLREQGYTDAEIIQMIRSDEEN